MGEQIIVKPMIFLTGVWILVVIHILAANTDLPAYFQLFFNSVICVYLGCFVSAKITKSKDNVVKRALKDDEEETMTSKDAYMFPVYGSCALFSIYCCYKFLPAYYLNLVFTCHFTFIGMLALAGLLEFPLSKYTPPHWKDLIVIDRSFKFNLYFTVKTLDIKLNYLEAVCVSIALFPTVMYFYTKHWIANNLFGIAFSVCGIENLSLPNFYTGFILLWGLFFYDIFWVYGTDVMITVAKSFDVPIKLMFPFKWESDGENPGPKFSMLGLGDIVIPGIFVALCLKYDLDRRLKNTKNVHSVQTPLFNWCFGGYILGIIVTYCVMVYFQHAQPALLFLVPGCTGAVTLYGLVFGKLKDIFAYQEEVGREQPEKKEVEGEKAEETASLLDDKKQN